MTSQNPHTLAELRSLATYMEVAKRITTDDRIVPEALARLERDYMRGSTSLHCFERWRALLLGPTTTQCSQITAIDEGAVSLRQASPFAGVLAPKERWALWKEVRRVFEMDVASRNKVRER